MTASNILKQFPEINFKPDGRFVWSPKDSTVYYNQDRVQTHEGLMALIHEIGHAKLGHRNYEFDIELVNMETEAWDKATKIAKKLGVKLNASHIETCLETYRIWMYKRSRCPECGNTSTQQNPSTYHCFNCGSNWRVAQTRTTQPRRMNCININ